MTTKVMIEAAAKEFERHAWPDCAWDKIHESARDRYRAVAKDALAAALRISGHPQFLSGCLLDGVCRGVCRNTDCPNHDMVVAARVCVFPKEDGIKYPKEPT